MRRVLYLVLLGLLTGILPSAAQQNEMSNGKGPQGKIVNNFIGNGAATTTTIPFEVGDRWEMRWYCAARMRIFIYRMDNTLLAGTRGATSAIFFDKGGTYYLQIDGPRPGSDNPPPKPTPGVAPIDLNTVSWSVMICNLGNENITPLAAAKPSTPAPEAPAPAVTPAPTVKLTEEQARAVVLIKGDMGQGTGFLIKTPEGSFVATNIHVIANNPHFKITTSAGVPVIMTGVKCAADRDLALLAIKDENYNYLETAADVSQIAAPGDEVITPGNSQGGEVMLNTAGKVLGLGPQRIEISNPVYHGNSGGPIFHAKSGKVVGVVTWGQKVETTNAIDKASHANKNSAIGTMRYYGYRLDTVSSWIPIDWRRLNIEVAFIDQFNHRSRSLDTYLNVRGNVPAERNDDDDPRAYLDDEVIMKAHQDYVQRAAGADVSQRREAAKGLLFALQGAADADMDQIQNPNNFYSFDRDRVKYEILYRQAVKDELDSIGGDPGRLSNLPRTNN